MFVTGWKLDQGQRAALLKRFELEWPSIIAEHVTLNAQMVAGEPLPAEVEGRFLGDQR